MRGVASFLLLALLAGAVHAQHPNPPRAIFGLTFGQSIELPPCEKMGTSSVAPKKGGCAEPTFVVRSGDTVDGKVRIRFSFGELPMFVKDATLDAKLVDGTLEGITFFTRGVNEHAAVLEALKGKFGEPTDIRARTVKNRLGAEFDASYVLWVLGDLSVTYTAVVGSLETGAVVVNTSKGDAFGAREAEGVKRATSGSRPL